MRLHRWAASMVAITFAFGCKGNAPAPAPEAAQDAGAEAATAEHKEGEKAKDAHSATGDQDRFVVPFAWEASRDEPLAQTRGYVRLMLEDNREYMRVHPATFFKQFAETEKPRMTVIACSDSRVQTAAFDATPENDVFTVRNLANQMATSEGSVDYGVRQLKTPILMILGHAGCTSIKTAMAGETSKEATVAKELGTLPPLKAPEAKPKEKEKEKGKEAKAEKKEKESKDKEKDKDHGAKDEDSKEAREAREARDLADKDPWLYGVITNVNYQVNLSVKRYTKEISEGELTVIGAVVDFRNDMRNGYGKFAIVNVNGNTEMSRIQAFVRAVEAGPGPAGSNSQSGMLPTSPKAVSSGLPTEAAIDALVKADEQRSNLLRSSRAEKPSRPNEKHGD